MNKLTKLLAACYGEVAGARLFSTLNKLSGSFEPKEASSDETWHREAILYVTYPDSFESPDGNGDFFTLAKEVPRIADLGCTAIHVLPFLSSPLIDAGFDVSDYFSIREKLGGEEGLREFLNQCCAHNIRPFMDIILNHVSDHHPWFTSALAGDEEKRGFFISRETRPPFSHTYENSSGVWAVYDEPDKEHLVRIMFPEQVGEIPHWRQCSDGRWYYHTFYPQQLDLNFCNPAVFLEFAKILVHWARLGFSFRLDAIEFIGKDSYFQGVHDNSVNFLIVEALRELVSNTAPQSVFLVEASQVMSEVRPYFTGAIRKRRADLAYNFQLAKALFYAILGGDVEAIWKRLDEAAKETNGASWITFLRTHDELSFEFATLHEIEFLRERLADRGLPFREEYGRSGRLMSLLDNSTRKHCGSLFLMSSLPGAILLYYGDEYGIQDKPEFMQNRTSAKNTKEANLPVFADDTRDIHRAPIDTTVGTDACAKEIHALVARLFKARRQFPEISTASPKRLESKHLTVNIFAAEYLLSTTKLSVFFNMGENAITIPLSHLQISEDSSTELTVGGVSIMNEELTLDSFSGIWLAS